MSLWQEIFPRQQSIWGLNSCLRGKEEKKRKEEKRREKNLQIVGLTNAQNSCYDVLQNKGVLISQKG